VTVTELAKERLGELAVDENEKNDEPYIINLINYVDPSNHYDKVNLTYYEEDDTLADSQEEIIPNCEEILGDEGLLNFGVGSEDPDTVFIRNDKISTDYEVSRDKRSYQELVMGIKPEPKVNPKVKGKRGKKLNDGDE